MIIHAYSKFDWEREALQHQRTVYVDIDDTLLLHHDFTETPRINWELVERLRSLKIKHGRGVQLVLWSGNAISFAGAQARRLQLFQLGLSVDMLFDAVLAKPHVILDDHADWFANTHLVDVTK